MRITILGTSPPDGTTKPGHAGTGIVVSLDATHLMLDCGPGVTKRLARVGVDLRDVDHLFLTHHHWDHIADLSTLVLGRFERSLFGSAKGDPLAPPLEVFGPEGTERIIELLFGPGGVYHGDIGTRTAPDMGVRIYGGLGATVPFDPPLPHAHDVAPGPVVETSSFRVVAAPAQHTQPYLASLAYRVESDEGSVVLAGDSAPSDDVVALARDVDVLVHEGAMDEGRRVSGALETIHSSSSTVGRTAAAAGAKKLVIVHHELDRDDVEARRQVEERIRADYDGEIWIASELDVLPVARV
jgi:ribonuclease Z